MEKKRKMMPETLDYHITCIFHWINFHKISIDYPTWIVLIMRKDTLKISFLAFLVAIGRSFLASGTHYANKFINTSWCGGHNEVLSRVSRKLFEI